MRITADTNLLVRVAVRDDETQAHLALRLLREAELVAISLPCLCEFVWVLGSVYRMPKPRIAHSIRGIMEMSHVSIDLAETEVLLRLLEAGGDFADGVIAAAGASMGAETFVSFDRNAVTRLNAFGISLRDATAAA